MYKVELFSYKNLHLTIGPCLTPKYKACSQRYEHKTKKSTEAGHSV